MKKLILLLALPLAVFAQVELDTVIDLGHRLYHSAHYLPELNKLYLGTDSLIIALDCSTWQVTAEIPADRYFKPRFAWNPGRRKLYGAFGEAEDESTWVIVIYPDRDSAHWLPLPVAFWEESFTYVGSHDLLYGSPCMYDTIHAELWALDCAEDTVVKVIESPAPPLEFITVSWDSVKDRVYSSIGILGAPPYVAVYDVKTDSLLAVIAAGVDPLKLNFHHPLRKAYFVPRILDNRAGVIDTDRIRLIRLFPFRTAGVRGQGPVAVNALMDKVYFGGHRSGTTCTLFVVDAVTDSIIKGVEYRGLDPHFGYVVWVPWSNRVYVYTRHHLVVLDCVTDSIIIPELVLPGQQRAPARLVLDPDRQRIFAIGANPTAVHVLRCIPSGVEEKRGPVPEPVQVTPTIVRGNLFLRSVSCPDHTHSALCLCGLKSSPVLLDASGRQVMELQPGDNDVRHLSPGVYFVREKGSRIQGSKGTSAKVVIQR